MLQGKGYIRTCPITNTEKRKVTMKVITRCMLAITDFYIHTLSNLHNGLPLPTVTFTPPYLLFSSTRPSILDRDSTQRKPLSEARFPRHISLPTDK